ncbi:hypothetical protein FNQ90_09445 [Streptomyces alkaliphilus]|uniref:Uncharacterized protein n=1 Tax=Streptomyces alkaliphilus TaxID=1472722 RepID=A0A7W3TCH7_9ACTN|nr:hypothetical protein [Streptomyces alkaliphilus]MBB0244324.1 hypothetical protein [Streptomyces alkaliphilus]
MAWQWRFEKADGTEHPPADPPGGFGTQGDAESWLGETWQSLTAEGIDRVVLLEDGAVVYGPMGLHAEDPPADPPVPGD